MRNCAGDKPARGRTIMIRRVTVAALGVAVLMAPGISSAQMPPDVEAKIAALGRVVDPENTGPIYAPLQEKEPYAFIKISRDVKYGADPRNVVDIFVDDSNFTGRPVLMFVHGGGTARTVKRAPGSPFYDNILVFAARNGMVGVNVEYRPAPEFPWPAAGEDLGAAVRYVAEHIASFGGDPNRIYLMGHSAGARHVSTYVAHPEFHGPNGSGLAGAIFSSGIYDLTKQEPNEGTRGYYGPDPKLYAERSALAGLVASKTPFMMSVAELDPPMFGAQFALLKDAMCKTERGCVRGVMLAKHSHMSESYAINTADTQFSSQILEFIRTGK
jgi:acetyl esterase/lipase